MIKNVQHPSVFIKQSLKNLNLSINACALHMNVAPSTLNRLINGKSNISPTMAIKLSKTLGQSPIYWMTTQMNYDLEVTQLKMETKND